MTNKDDSEVVKIQGRLTVTQGLWDYERTQILQALGITGDINPRAWTTDALVREITDCITGQKMLSGDDIPKPGQRIDNVLELAPNDAELQRAWKTFPDPVSDNHGFSWGIRGHRINRPTVGACVRARTPSDRIPDCLRAGSCATRLGSLKTNEPLLTKRLN